MNDGDGLDAGDAATDRGLCRYLGPVKLHAKQSGNGLESVADAVVDLTHHGAEEVRSLLSFLVEIRVFDGHRGAMSERGEETLVVLREFSRDVR